MGENPRNQFYNYYLILQPVLFWLRFILKMTKADWWQTLWRVVGERSSVLDFSSCVSNQQDEKVRGVVLMYDW